VALGVAVLLVWSLVRFEGTPAARVAVVVGLAAILVSGYIGFGMAAEGESVVDATGRVPEGVVFGAAGSAKLAHAVGMHGLQLLGLLAVGTGLRPRRPLWPMAFASVALTAYAGRAWTSPPAALAALGVAGVVAIGVACAVVARGVFGRSVVAVRG
jgi:hypothetical protein